MQEEKFFYQPNFVTSAIIWSWTIIILLLGVIVWLEITHFQWITALLFIAFIGLTAAQVFRRTLIMTPDTLTFNRMLQSEYLVIPRKNVTQIRYTKTSLHFTISGQTFNFSFTPHTLQSIKTILDRTEA